MIRLRRSFRMHFASLGSYRGESRNGERSTIEIRSQVLHETHTYSTCITHDMTLDRNLKSSSFHYAGYSKQVR